MLNDSFTDKFLAVFYSLDADGNGTIEFDDFASHAHYIKKEQNWGDDDPRWLKLINAKQSAWEKIKAHVDLNNDGVVSKDEWLTFCEKSRDAVKATGEPAQWKRDIFRSLFQSLDLNGDGVISPEEYGLHLRSIGVTGDPNPAFNRADANGDGHLTFEELDEMMLQWWVSDDPNDPGNCFFSGKVPAG